MTKATVVKIESPTGVVSVHVDELSALTQFMIYSDIVALVQRIEQAALKAGAIVA